MTKKEDMYDEDEGRAGEPADAPFGRYTVYGSETRSFASPSAALIWAREQHRRTGETLECRDDNLDHVFTVES